ncbi:MAG: HAMP domain-containing sensor histidine kinase [Pseudomonadota bacterium]
MLQNSAFQKVREKWHSYVLQAIFIFISVLLSLIAASWVLQQVLVKEALELEADSFISQRLQDEDFPLPRTRNLVGYLSCTECENTLPAALLDLPAGLHAGVRLEGKRDVVPVYVRDSDFGRLYLVFEGQNVDRLVGFFGIIPLSLLLIVVYVTSWVAYKLSASAVSPVLKIARRLQNTKGDETPLNITTSQYRGEARELAHAVEDYTKRIDEMIEREQQFSADVSHELRTPITIIDGAAQFIEAENGVSEKGRERIRMIRRASRDISELVDAFLILARDPVSIEITEELNVAEVAESELNKLRNLIGDSGIELNVQRNANLRVSVNKKVLEIILGNLCRNAIKHTEQGHITVYINENQVIVGDTGSGVDEAVLPDIFDRHVKGRGTEKAGEGLGLNIVKRLCNLCGWEIRIANKPVAGVLVTIDIPPE